MKITILGCGAYGLALSEMFSLNNCEITMWVIAVHIGNFQNRAGDFQHKDVRHRGQAGGVELVRQIIEGAVVFQPFRMSRRGCIVQRSWRTVTT